MKWLFRIAFAAASTASVFTIVPATAQVSDHPTGDRAATVHMPADRATSDRTAPAPPTSDRAATVRMVLAHFTVLPPITADQDDADTSDTAALNILLASQTTDYHHASLSQTKNIELVAKRLNGLVVPPNGSFSYYKTVGPYTAANGYQWGRAFVRDKIVPSMGGGVCQGASTLYAALLRTGLKVTERHQHSLTVPYLPPGEDATVAGTYYNFRFVNNRSTPIRLAASADSSLRKMTVAIYGATPAPQIAVHHQILGTTPFPVKRKYDATLAAGESKVISPGQDGVKVHSWLETTGPSGKTIHDLGVDTYLPSPRVVEVGGHSTTEKRPAKPPLK